MLGGRTLNGLPRNPYAEASQRILSAVYEHYNADPEQARFFASGNLALSRHAFARLGGFDAQGFPFVAAEDRDLCDRWLRSGGRMVFVPEAEVLHAHDLSLAAFCRQHFGYGRGAFRFHNTRDARRESLRFHRSARAWWRMCSDRSPVRFAQLVVLLGVWQVVNLAGFLWEWRRAGPRSGLRHVPGRRAGSSSGPPPGGRRSA